MAVVDQPDLDHDDDYESDSDAEVGQVIVHRPEQCRFEPSRPVYRTPRGLAQALFYMQQQYIDADAGRFSIITGRVKEVFLLRRSDRLTLGLVIDDEHEVISIFADHLVNQFGVYPREWFSQNALSLTSVEHRKVKQHIALLRALL